MGILVVADTRFLKDENLQTHALCVFWRKMQFFTLFWQKVCAVSKRQRTLYLQHTRIYRKKTENIRKECVCTYVVSTKVGVSHPLHT